MKLLIIFLVSPLLLLSQSLTINVNKYFELKEYVKAEQELLEYLKKDPNSLDATELLGDTYGLQEEWDKAINSYKILVDSKPNNADYHYKYGGVLGMKARYGSKMKALSIIDDVKEAFLTAAELDANHIDARWALVQLYMQLPGIIGGSKRKALKYANELVSLSIVDGYLAKGYIYEYDEESELAEKYYKMAIKEGGSISCYSKLTSFYENQKEPEKAIHNIEESHSVHQSNAMNYQIGKISAEYNIELRKGEQCLNMYIKNYQVSDGVPVAWANYRLAQIYKHQNNKKMALEYIDFAIKELPKIEPFKEERQAILNL